MNQKGPCKMIEADRAFWGTDDMSEAEEKTFWRNFPYCNVAIGPEIEYYMMHGEFRNPRFELYELDDETKKAHMIYAYTDCKNAQNAQAYLTSHHQFSSKKYVIEIGLGRNEE